MRILVPYLIFRSEGVFHSIFVGSVTSCLLSLVLTYRRFRDGSQSRIGQDVPINRAVLLFSENGDGSRVPVLFFESARERWSISRYFYFSQAFYGLECTRPSTDNDNPSSRAGYARRNQFRLARHVGFLSMGWVGWHENLSVFDLSLERVEGHRSGSVL